MYRWQGRLARTEGEEVMRPGVAERMLRTATFLYAGGVVTSKWLRKEFGVSRPQAMRDMQTIALYLPVERIDSTRVQRLNGCANVLRMCSERL